MSEQFVTTTKHFRKLLAAGYLLIVLLVGGIICTWLGEWRDLELLERENREINRFRKETHDAYVGVVELSLLGESVLEWDDKDVAAYRRQRMTVDSMLCRFKSHYESVRIDSVRHLLEDKEKRLCAIMEALEQQADINRRIAKQVPVIVQTSRQEEPKKQNFGRTAKDEEKEVPPVSLKEEAKASQYQAISSMLTEPRPPMVVPPKVIKVLILPYQGSKGELFMSRYVYLQMEKSSWILTDTKEKR